MIAMLMKRAVLCLPMLVLVVPATTAQPAPLRKPSPAAMQVYKTPTCGCCGKWVEHVKAAGFTTTVHDRPDISQVKMKAGVPASLQSCHTALVGGYVIEGHVPADVIRQLLAEKPKIAGIAVPGMPIGSPGMEQGTRKDAYEVIAFTRDGTTSVYATR
jgi:hypothetical protein